MSPLDSSSLSSPLIKTQEGGKGVKQVVENKGKKKMKKKKWKRKKKNYSIPPSCLLPLVAKGCSWSISKNNCIYWSLKEKG